MNGTEAVSSDYGGTGIPPIRNITEVGAVDPVPITWDPASVVLLVICVVGIIGNLISISMIVILKEYKKSVLHMYVIQLALADLSLLFTHPFQLSQNLHNAWLFPDWMCVLQKTMLYLNYNASVLFLMVISFDRYVAVSHLHRGLSKYRTPLAVKIIIVIVWCIAILCCIPTLLYTRTIGVKPNCLCQFRFPSDNMENQLQCVTTAEHDAEVAYSGSEYGYYEYDYGEIDYDEIVADECHYFGSSNNWFIFIYMNFVGLYILPVLVMSVTYGFIIYKIRKIPANNQSYQLNTLQNSQSEARKRVMTKKSGIRHQITVMTVAMVSAFIVSWLPFHAVHLAKINGMTNIPYNKGYICDQLATFASLLALSNSATNPLLYGLLRPYFKKRMRNFWSITVKSIEQRTGLSLPGGGDGRKETSNGRTKSSPQT